MLKINHILEEKEIKDFLTKRGLLDQYLKAVNHIKSGFFGKQDFKLRKPKNNGIYSFRINKQYRAVGFFKNDNVFIVSFIDNHQN